MSLFLKIKVYLKVWKDKDQTVIFWEKDTENPTLSTLYIQKLLEFRII